MHFLLLKGYISKLFLQHKLLIFFNSLKKVYRLKYKNDSFKFYLHG